MGVHQYQPTGLLKLKRQDVTLINNLLRFFPISPFTKDFRKELNKKLSPFLQADFDIWLEEIEALKPHEVKSKLPPCTALVELGLPPKSHSVLMEVDLTIAQQAVDRILGGPGTETDPERPLSDIEEGIFSFILLKAINICQKNIGEEMGLHFQILEQSHTVDNLFPDWDDDDDLYVVGFRVFLDLQVGYLRLIVPSSLLTEAGILSTPEQGPSWERLKQRLVNVFQMMDNSLFPLQVEAGRSELSLEDIDGLENEDIILLENTELTVSGEEIAGEVNCTFGNGVKGYLKSSLQISESGEFQVVVRDIIPISPPNPNDINSQKNPDGDHGPMDENEAIEENEENNDSVAQNEVEENLSETKHLLEDVTVPMVVEMGRVGLTAMEIAQLRSGTMFELGREPGANVQLVVDGKHIGDGELVEIEGQLGVRVLSLHRKGNQ